MLVLHVGQLLPLWNLDAVRTPAARTREKNDVLTYPSVELDHCKHLPLTQQVMSDLWPEKRHSPLALVLLSDV